MVATEDYRGWLVVATGDSWIDIKVVRESLVSSHCVRGGRDGPLFWPRPSYSTAITRQHAWNVEWGFRLTLAGWIESRASCEVELMMGNTGAIRLTCSALAFLTRPLGHRP